MGTTLTGTTPATTYDSLIKVTDNGPLSATAKYLSDGLGNDSALALSTSAVGIGTASPAAKLDIVGASGNTQLNITSVSGTFPFITLDQTGVVKYAIQNVATTGLFTITEAGVGNRLVIEKTSGNVGIGTDSPTAKLTVKGTVGLLNDEVAAGYATLNIVPATAIGASANRIAALNTTDIAFETSGSERMRIDSAGNVGIGTSSPTQSLDTAGKLRVRDGGNTTIPAIQMAASGVSGFANPSGTDIGIITNSTEKVRITSTGNVGIGTDLPATLLDVSSTGYEVAAFRSTYGQMAVSFANGGTTFAQLGSGVSVTGTGGAADLGFGTAGQATASIVFATGAGFTERFRITNNGVTFNGDTAAANALDDYEEGTWTGTLTGSSSNPTTPVTATGRYTKIGRIVTAEIQIDSADTTGASGDVIVTGLPFASLTEAQGGAMCNLYAFGASCTSVNSFVSSAGTSMRFYTSGSGVLWGALTHSAGAGRSLRGTITYFV